MKEITREDVLKLCEKWQKELKVNVKRVQIREMKNKWGSYSSNGVLTLNKELLRYPLAQVVNVIEKLLSRFMDAVVVATEGIAEKFQQFKPVVIHNYPDLRMFSSFNSSFSPQEKKEKVGD